MIAVPLSGFGLLLVLATMLLPAVSLWAGQPEPVPAPRVPSGAWARVLDGHPRLYGSGEYLRALARAKPDAYAEIRQSRDSLPALCVTQAVEGLPPSTARKLIDEAKTNVARGVTNLHQSTWGWMEQTALVFDFLHDQLTADERAAMVAWLNAHLGTYTDDESAFHNSTLAKIRCYLEVAYATWGENPRAKEFRDYALLTLYEGKIVPVFEEFGQGGAWTEAPGDGRGAMWHLVEALELARRIEGYDGFQKAPRFFYQRLVYELHQSLPGTWANTERYDIEGDDMDTAGWWRTETPRHVRTLLAQYFRGSELARIASARRRPGSNPLARLIDFLYDEGPEAEPLPLSSLPRAHLSRGIGRVYARSDWGDDATWFRFECGPYFSAHQHFEVGNFTIFRREPLAAESGEYWDFSSGHDVNWLLRTIAHNSLLVYLPGERWAMLRDGGRQEYANDGGQAQKWRWPVGDLTQWQAQRAHFERGRITAYDSHPEYLYVAADGTAAYSPEKLALWTRQIVFLRPSTFVILDRVVSQRPEYEKTWVLHSHAEPLVTGSGLQITNGVGRLYLQSLLPAGRQIRVVHGYTYGGRDFSPETDRFAAIGNRWRTEVAPAAPQREDLFLHVLSTEADPRAILLQEGERVGVRVDGAEVVFMGDWGGTLKIGDRSLALRPEVRTGAYESGRAGSPPAR